MPVSGNSEGEAWVALVDDDESLLRSFSRLLRAAGRRTLSYSSAESFLSDRGRVRIACLVLDVQLPGMSGLELGQYLVRLADDTPVIYVTALDEPDIYIQARRIGCAGFFHKSDSGEAVLAAINRALDRTAGQPLEE